jgi:hypothetical protein
VANEEPERTEDSAIQTFIHSDKLTVRSPSAEQIRVYSLSGTLLYSVQKDAGEANFDVGRLPKGVLIIRGSSGWVKKVIRN